MITLENPSMYFRFILIFLSAFCFHCIRLTPARPHPTQPLSTVGSLCLLHFSGIKCSKAICPFFFTVSHESLQSTLSVFLELFQNLSKHLQLSSSSALVLWTLKLYLLSNHYKQQVQVQQPKEKNWPISTAVKCTFANPQKLLKSFWCLPQLHKIMFPPMFLMRNTSMKLAWD